MTLIAIKPRQDSHWYFADGRPCYEVPMATRPSETRRPTVRDARKMGLVPSVTTILKVISRPGLEMWKMEQVLLSALTHPMPKGAQPHEHIAAILEEADAEARRAADLGTIYHDAFASWLTDRARFVLPQQVHAETMRAVEDWFDTTFWPGNSLIEHCFACDAGYGGRLDFAGMSRMRRRTIVDYKSQETQAGKPFKRYGEYACQLAACAYGIGWKDADLVSLMVSRTEPGRIEAYKWTEGCDVWYRTFMDAFAVWKGLLGSNYEPVTSEVESVF